jgi:hypothetical protein
MPVPAIIRGAPALSLIAALACKDATQSFEPPTALSSASSEAATARCKAAPPDDVIKLPIAPRSKRVDLAVPVFSRPTEVTNPLFPIKRLHHAVLVGEAEGEPFRAETTLLPGTKALEFEGGRIEALISQYVAYLNGRLHEVALDWYAQDDDGNVWYFGEDVFNYEDGRVANTEGTWVSCKDGPPAMIMPRQPRVGNVFRVENIYPVVFEEVEVTRTNQTVRGPLDPVRGAITVRQLHLDGSFAPKIFAPGYGEFSTGSGHDFESLALAVPANRAAGPVPRELSAILDGAEEAYESATKGDWSAARQHITQVLPAWRQYRMAGLAPFLLQPLMTGAAEALRDGVSRRDAATARQAAVNVARQGLDLLVRHAARTSVDLDRLDVFTRQLAIDADGRNQGGARGTLVIMGLILDRLASIEDRKTRGRLARVRSIIAELSAANERGDFAAVFRGAVRLERILGR